jgi:hypothetical protein
MPRNQHGIRSLITRHQIASMQSAKVFWFFFSKKNRCLPIAS